MGCQSAGLTKLIFLAHASVGKPKIQILQAAPRTFTEDSHHSARETGSSSTVPIPVPVLLAVCTMSKALPAFFQPSTPFSVISTLSRSSPLFVFPLLTVVVSMCLRLWHTSICSDEAVSFWLLLIRCCYAADQKEARINQEKQNTERDIQ